MPGHRSSPSPGVILITPPPAVYCKPAADRVQKAICLDLMSPVQQGKGRTRLLRRCQAATICWPQRIFTMLDFTRDTDDFSSSDAPEPASSAAPADDQALFDAYSNAVISVTERIGPAVVRVEVGPKTPQARARGGPGFRHVPLPLGVV